MKKQLILILVMILLMVSACSFEGQIDFIRGSGTTVTEERAVDGIRGVTLATLGDLTIELGEVEALIIEAEDNLLPHLETTVRGGILTIGNEPGTNLLPTEPVRYYLTVTSLESLSVTSSGNIDAPAMHADRFTVTSSSSGDIHLARLEAARIDVEISSSGDIAIDGGQVAEQDIEISSSGAYRAEDVRCEHADVEISSSGNVNVWVTEDMEARLSSSGNVNYYGDADVQQSTTSSGKVVSLGNK